MNHKRRRPKNRRAGCLYCKPHKANGAKEKTKAKYRDELMELCDRLDDAGISYERIPGGIRYESGIYLTKPVYSVTVTGLKEGDEE